MNNNSAIQKYLDRYGYLTDYPLASIKGDYQYILTIPCFNEPITALEQIKAINTNRQNLLTILVVNAPQGATSSELNQNNQLIRHAIQKTSTIVTHPAGHYLRLSTTHDLLILNTDHSKYHNCNVGMARKIGADTALALWHEKKIKSPWIFCTDADATLPRDYFTHTEKWHPKTPALTYPFVHEHANSTLKAVAETYQSGLEQYYHGLKKAGSPYAFFAIGSTMVINMTAYCQVRGFPQRAAGEDFYMLNKLAKQGPIEIVDGLPILLSARLSTRTPFGTGQALGEMMAHPNQAYKPLAFTKAHYAILESTLQLIKTLDHPSNWNPGPAGSTDPMIIDGLISLGFDNFIEKMKKQARSPQQFNSELMAWFDGLKTLQLLKFVRTKTSSN